MLASTASRAAFDAALLSPGPAPDRAEALGLYGRFVGDWERDAVVRKDDGTRHEGRGEIHFAWVLQGRAIQDVWILPGAFYGTTLRIYDPGLAAWHIFWHDPVTPYYLRQLGRAAGPDIVQEGRAEGGGELRWRFTEITLRSFHWIGERRPDAAAAWERQVDFHARRVG